MFNFDHQPARQDGSFLAISSSTSTQLDVMSGFNYIYVSDLGDIAWDKKSLCAHVYVMPTNMMLFLIKGKEYLPVGNILTLSDEDKTATLGQVPVVSLAELVVVRDSWLNSDKPDAEENADVENDDDSVSEDL